VIDVLTTIETVGGGAELVGEVGVAEVWAGVAAASTLTIVEAAGSCLASDGADGAAPGVATAGSGAGTEGVAAGVVARTVAGAAEGASTLAGVDAGSAAPGTGEDGLFSKVGSLKKAEFSMLRSTLGTGEEGVEVDEADVGWSFCGCGVAIGRDRRYFTAR